MADEKRIFGLLAEFDDPATLIRAAEKMRDEGYQYYDCHSPFPIHGMDRAMGLKRSIVGYIAGFMAFVGFSLGLGLQWWTSAVDYPLVIAGKPYFSYQAFVPVTFGLTVLLGAFGAFLGMLHTNRLPRLYHELFFSERFSRKVTNDGFFVSVVAKDPKFDRSATTSLLESLGGKHVEVIKSE